MSTSAWAWYPAELRSAANSSSKLQSEHRKGRREPRTSRQLDRVTPPHLRLTASSREADCLCRLSNSRRLKGAATLLAPAGRNGYSATSCGAVSDESSEKMESAGLTAFDQST